MKTNSSNFAIKVSFSLTGVITLMDSSIEYMQKIPTFHEWVIQDQNKKEETESIIETERVWKVRVMSFNTCHTLDRNLASNENYALEENHP